jgi:hypothetical protein
MATTRLNLTRDQLASFLKDHEQIRQFERLFADVNQLEPTTLVDLAITASTAGQQAVEALDALNRIANALEMVAAAPVAPLDPTPALREIQADLAATQAQAQQALTLASELAPVVQGLQCLPPPREFKRVRYGQFYNTATQTQATANVAASVAFNTTDISVGVRLRSPSTSEIEVDTEGIYNFQVSMQFDSSSGSNREVWVWFRKNGTDIANSAIYLNIQNNQSELLQAFNLLVEMKALDYLEVMWEVGNINAEMAAFAATGVHPAVPSIILTVSDNIQGFL